MNPVSEQKYTKETIEVTNTKGNRNRPITLSEGTPSTSQTHGLERQLSLEVSSFRMPTDKDYYIKERYREIKARNDKLKVQTYAQYLKMTPTNQARLMLAFDIKEGKMQMNFIKPTTQQQKIALDFKKVHFEVLARDIHPRD